MLHFPLLSVIIFLPLLGGFLALATGSRWPLACRWISLTTTLLEFSLVSSLENFEAGRRGFEALFRTFRTTEADGRLAMPVMSNRF